MFKNHLLNAWRALRRNRLSTLVNLTGLSLGIACALLIFAVVTYHFSFDQFHQEGERTYRVVTEWHNEGIDYSGGTPRPLGSALKDFSDLELVARRQASQPSLISVEGPQEKIKFEEADGVAFTEPDFFKLFSFPLKSGTYKTALKEPNQALLTEKMAKKYFGSKDPVGQIILVNNNRSFTVVGVLKDLPTNTDFRQEIYLSYHELAQDEAADNWMGVFSGHATFARLKEGTSSKVLDQQLKSLTKKVYPDKMADVWNLKSQALSDIHFNPNYDGVIDRKYLWALVFIASLLILTACINFTNLATAQAMIRSREIGVRKVLGSGKVQLFWQFMTETAIVTFVALSAACLLAKLVMLPILNRWMNASVELNLLSNAGLLLFIALLFLLVTFLSGIYPAWIQAGFQPIRALKSKINQKDIGGFSLRRLLVIGQFAITQILIVTTLVIAWQMYYINRIDLGFRKDAIVNVPVPDRFNASKMKTFRDRIGKLPGAEQVSLNFQPPASQSNNSAGFVYANREEEENVSINLKYADEHYLETFNLELLAGRNFFPSDTIKEFLVNETFLASLRIQDPQEVIGKKLAVNGQENKGVIVGVVKDFYNNSLYSARNAICIMPSTIYFGNCSVLLKGGQVATILPEIKQIWEETYPEYAYNYSFMDESVARFYEMDRLILKLIQSFSLIAILIGCLGLYGLISFLALTKTKEIGVRKVLGANLKQILWLFGKELSILLMSAFLISAPVAWFYSSRYLEDFTYRVEPGVGVFLASLFISVLIAGLTAGYRSLLAARKNPVDSIRTD